MISKSEQRICYYRNYLLLLQLQSTLDLKALIYPYPVRARGLMGGRGHDYRSRMKNMQ